MRKFKRSFLIVIETPYQARVFDVGNWDGAQNILYFFVVGAAIFVEELVDGGESFDDRLVFGNLAVEDAQRIGDIAALAVSAHFFYYGCERLAKSFVEFCSVGGAAYGVQFERPVGDAHAVEQRGEEFEDFRVSGGRQAAGGGGADDFGSNLIELAVAAFLRTLAAELRSNIEELAEPAIPKLVLDVGADYAGGVFGAQGQGLSLIAFGAAAIFPGKHLFGDDVSLFAHPAGKQFGGLEDGGADFVEIVPAKYVADSGFDEVPERRVGRKKIAGSSGGFDH